MNNTQQNTDNLGGAGAGATTANHDPALEKEILKLIKESATMQQVEKDGWIELMPQMNDSQINELKVILATEKEKLKEIDTRYKKKIEKLEKDYIENYLAKKSRKKWARAREKEQSHLEESDEQAEELLGQL